MTQCCIVPESEPKYSPPINYNSDLLGGHPSLNTESNCDVQGGQYPYAEQDHLALRHLAFKNFIRPRTLDGKTVFKPVDEEQYSCECNLSRTPLTSKYNNETLKFEVKSGVIKRGCDCIKRNGLQDRCPRVRHENRWECVMGLPHGCTSGAVRWRPHYANHLQRPAKPPYSNPCASASSLRGDLTKSQGTSFRSNQPARNTREVQSRSASLQVIPNNQNRPETKRSRCLMRNTSRTSQMSRSCLSKNTPTGPTLMCTCKPII